MCTGAELTALLPSAIGAAGSIGGSAIGSSGANSATMKQIAAMQAGTAEQQRFATDMFNYDKENNYDAGQWLKDKLPQFDMTKLSAPTTPNFSYSPNANQYFGAGKVNDYYDTASNNIMNNANTSASNAMSSFGASSASRGLANPSAGIAMAGNNAFQGFIPQLGNLETSRAGALLNNQKDLYDADFQGNQYNNQLGQLNFGNQMQGLNFNSQQNQILNNLRQQNYGNLNNFAQTYGNPNSPFKKFSFIPNGYNAAGQNITDQEDHTLFGRRGVFGDIYDGISSLFGGKK